jgi:hypothetical protein
VREAIVASGCKHSAAPLAMGDEVIYARPCIFLFVRSNTVRSVSIVHRKLTGLCANDPTARG